ncbi:MAG: hypothetical protein KDC03_17955 [Flavobacteriales bacterium]|nr:hypothetical protein [Flavobacteriales bacterium]
MINRSDAFPINMKNMSIATRIYFMGAILLSFIGVVKMEYLFDMSGVVDRCPLVVVEVVQCDCCLKGVQGRRVLGRKRIQVAYQQRVYEVPLDVEYCKDVHVGASLEAYYDASRDLFLLKSHDVELEKRVWGGLLIASVSLLVFVSIRYFLRRSRSMNSAQM